MNSCLLLLAVILSAISGAHISPNPRDTLADFSIECTFQTNISPTTLTNIVNQNPPDNDPIYRSYILCFLQKMGILDTNGNFVEDTTQLQVWLPAEKAKEKLETAKTKCGDVKGETAPDTAARIFRCFINKGV